MRIGFCRVFDKSEYSVTIKRVADVANAFIEFYIDSTEVHFIRKECDDAIKEIRGYNVGFGNAENAREQFNKYLEVDSISSHSEIINCFKELIRVMAITNGLGHYFEMLSSMDVTESFLKECFEERVSGFIFLDWNEVSTDKVGDNQILYVSNDELDKKYESKLDVAYKTGKCGKITFNEISHYYFTSKDLEENAGLDETLRHEIIKIVNTTLARKFGG